MKAVNYTTTSLKNESQVQNNVCQDNNIIKVNFGTKKKLTENDIYNLCYDKWIRIRRADDETKTIVMEAIWFIAAFEFLFLKHPEEIIFNKELLKRKTIAQKRQRRRYLDQLAALYNITFHTKYTYEGKTYRDVYSATRTLDCQKILENPQFFYQNQFLKIPDVSSEMTTPEVKNDHSIYSIIEEDYKYLDNLDIKIEQTEKVVEPPVTNSNITQFKPNFSKGKHPSEWEKFNTEEIEAIRIASKRSYSTNNIIQITDYLPKKVGPNKLFSSREALIKYAIQFVKGEDRPPSILNQPGFIMITAEQYREYKLGCEAEKQKIHRDTHRYKPIKRINNMTQQDTNSTISDEKKWLPQQEEMKKDPNFMRFMQTNGHKFTSEKPRLNIPKVNVESTIDAIDISSTQKQDWNELVNKRFGTEN